MGFPSGSGAAFHTPFDTIGDFLRGTRGIMLDMYRKPDKLVEAIEKLVPIHIEMGLRARKIEDPLVNIPLHKGAEGFMSIKQYETFYWPTLKKVIIRLIEKGLVPRLLFEGENTSRLEIIKDIPRGKAIYWFEKVDICKAKEVLGDTVCFMGNVPVSLLATATPEEVKAHVKNLIDVVLVKVVV
jgi:uroporphyrinogen-III decarboxylase